MKFRALCSSSCSQEPRNASGAAALRAYLEHPTHADLGARFFECFEQALMYDFDVQDGHAGLATLIEEEGL